MSEGIVYGDYYLLGRLNTGGMAEVFLGKRLGDAVGARLLAVKRMLTQFSDDTQIVRMFEEEARIARRLHHPNICEVLDEGVHNQQLYLAMEFIHGKDLRVMSQRARKAGERISYAVTAFVAAAIADALAYAHGLTSAAGEPEPIIHRDVSPQNILVSYDGVPKLIDFGIAKAKNRAVETRVGLVKGKYGYMSPEQATGAALDARSDVFSLGVVLYELSTGLQPFRAASDVSTLRKVARAAAVPALTANAALPPALAAIIDKALQRDPAKRQQSAAALATELREFIREDGRHITTESLSRTMREMFRDDYERERVRIEHYQSLPTPAVTTAMADEKTDFDNSRTIVSPVVAPEAMLAAGYGAEDEQTSADDMPDDEEMLEMIGDDEDGVIERTAADDPQTTLATLASAKEDSIDSDSFEHLQPSLDDEATGADAPPSSVAAKVEDNPWSTARTRTFPINGGSVIEPPRPYVPIPEGPTVVAGSIPMVAVPAPATTAVVFDEQTKVYGDVSELAGLTRPTSLAREVTTKEQVTPDDVQLSQVLGALSPMVTATTVTPAPVMARPEKALTQVAPMPQPPPKKIKSKGPAPLVDDEPTDAREVEDDLEAREEPTENDIVPEAIAKPAAEERRSTDDQGPLEEIAEDAHDDTRNEQQQQQQQQQQQHDEPQPQYADDTDYIPLFTRSETITLLIAAMMGFLIMTASYLYALNVQLPDPDPMVEQQQQQDQ